MMQLYNEKLDLFIYFLNSNSLVSVFLFDVANSRYRFYIIPADRTWSVYQGCFLWWSTECHDKNENQEFLITCRDWKDDISQLAKVVVPGGLLFVKKNIQGEK